MATTLQDLQRLHNRLWLRQPEAREMLTDRLDEYGVKVSAQDYVELDGIATQIIADRRNIPYTKPEMTAFHLGRLDWLPHIRYVRENICLGSGGRPRHDADAKLLFALWQSSGKRPEWKAIALKFERQTGTAKTAEGCRSAVRRLRARINR